MRSAYPLVREPIRRLQDHLPRTDALCTLLRELQAIPKSATPYIPDFPVIRHDLASNEEQPLDSWFYPVAAYDETTIDEIKFRHHRIQDIFTASDECMLHRSPEAEWNVRVHGPVLDLALCFAKNVQHKDRDLRILTRLYDQRALNNPPAYFINTRPITAARLRPEFRGTKELGASEVKVDWGVFIRPLSPLSEALDRERQRRQATEFEVDEFLERIVSRRGIRTSQIGTRSGSPTKRRRFQEDDLADSECSTSVASSSEDDHMRQLFSQSLAGLSPAQQHEWENIQRRRAQTFDITHFKLPLNAQAPLAISVETKGGRGDRLYGGTQLASWAMAHHMHLDSVAKAARSRSTTEMPGEEPGVTQDTSLPILALIFVDGHTWKAEFALRSKGETIVFGECYLGSTDKLEGIYCLLQCLQLLTRWATSETHNWWLRTLCLE